MKINAKIFFSSIFIFVLFGCSSPPLHNWVSERGYQFHKDYSSIDTLGWEVNEKRILTPNQFMRVAKRVKGELPDLNQSKSLAFKIEGKTETQNFLKKLGDVGAAGAFESVFSAEVHLKKPFKYQANRLVPLAACDKKEMTIVTKVLNTGTMTVKVFNKEKINISGKITIKGMETGGKSELTFEDENSETGGNLYVGYFPQRFKCVSIAKKDNLLLPIGQPTEFGGIDFYYLKYNSATDEVGNQLPVGETYIVPSGYYHQENRATELTSVFMELAQQIAKVNLDERLNPVEEELVALASLAGKTEYLETKVKDLELYSYNANKNFKIFSYADYPWRAQAGGDVVRKPEGWWDPYEQWKLLNSEEEKLKKRSQTDLPSMKEIVEGQTKISQRKTGILAKLTTNSGPVANTSAGRYPLYLVGVIASQANYPILRFTWKLRM